MKKYILATAIILSLAAVSTNAMAEDGIMSKAKSLFSSSKDEKAPTPAAAPATASVTAPAASTPVASTPKIDPVFKEMQELQQKQSEEMVKLQKEYDEKRQELLEKYKKQLEKDNADELKAAIKSCESRAVEELMMRKSMGIMMPAPMGMPPAR